MSIKSVPTAIMGVVTTFVLKQQISPSGRVAVASATAVAGLWTSLAVGSSGLIERTVVVAFLLIAPALALIRLLPNVNGVAALIVGAAGAATINILVAQVMLAVNAWSPHTGVITVGLVAALLRLAPTHGPQARLTTKRGAK